MSGYPYYSPPPPPYPPPPPPNCTSPPPPPPPKCNPCPCVCICELKPPPVIPPPPYAPPPPYRWAPIPAPTPQTGPDDHTVIIAVFVSLGGAFFLAFLAVGLFCLAKKKKKVIIPPPVEAAACIEEHQLIQETITTSACREQTVTVTVDEDVQIHEAVGSSSYVEQPSDCGTDGHLKSG